MLRRICEDLRPRLAAPEAHRDWLYPRAAAVAALLLAAINATFGERSIDPTAFDQVAYHWLAANMWDMLFQRGFIPVYSARWFPSLLARVATTLIGEPPKIGPLAVYFDLQLIAVYAAAGWLWGKIALALDLTWKGLWIGFVLLFLNFFGLKYLNWASALTDGPCFVLALGLLWAFLARRTRLLLLFGFMGAFTFPGFDLMTAVLVAFPRRPIEPLSGTSADGILLAGRWWAANAHLIIAAACALAVTAIDCWIALRLGFDLDVWPGSRMPELAPLSIAIAAAYLFFGALYLGDGRWWEQLFSTPWRHAVLGISFFLGVNALRIFLTRYGNYNQLEAAYCDPCDVPAFYGPVLFLRGFMRPAEFFVGHAIYFGLITPLLLVCWRRVAGRMREQGLGLVLVAGFGLVLGFDKVARHLTQVFPFFAAFLALALDRAGLSARSVWALAVLNLAASHVWYPLNRPGVERWDTWEQGDSDAYLDGIILGHPLYMDGPLFLALLGALMVVTLLLWLWLRAPSGDNERAGRVPQARLRRQRVPSGE